MPEPNNPRHTPPRKAKPACQLIAKKERIPMAKRDDATRCYSLRLIKTQHPSSGLARGWGLSRVWLCWPSARACRRPVPSLHPRQTVPTSACGLAPPNQTQTVPSPSRCCASLPFQTGALPPPMRSAWSSRPPDTPRWRQTESPSRDRCVC